MDRHMEQLEGRLHAVSLLLLVALDEIARLRATRGPATVAEAKRDILDSVRAVAPGIMAKFEDRGRPTSSTAFETSIEEFADKLMRLPAARRREDGNPS